MPDGDGASGPLFAIGFALEAPGVPRVTNESYGNDEQGGHTYRVNVESGVPRRV